MADKKKMSIEEILAACRTSDAGGGSPPSSAGKPAEESGGETPAAAPPPAPTTEAAKAAAGGGPAKPAATKPGAMSIAEILASARADKKGDKAAAAAAPGSEAAAESTAPAAPAAPAKKPAGAMSVAEMLAAARGEKAKPAAKAPAPSAAKPAAPAEKPAKPKVEKAASAQEGAGGPQDTASVLAAARRGTKPGPMSKAEAAAAKVAPAAPRKPAAPPMPERPAYLAAAKPATPQEGRRTFFGSFAGLLFGSSLAVGFSSLFVTNLLWLLGLARFMFPNILTEPPTIFKVGFPSDYAPGQVESKFVAQYGVWIVRYEYAGQSQIYALRTVCTHLGCTPNWLDGEQKFKCPCHGSGFYKDGINFEGPAPRPLERYAIRVADDGQLEVDKSRKFQEEMGQWKDAQSFVTV